MATSSVNGHWAKILQYAKEIGVPYTFEVNKQSISPKVYLIVGSDKRCRYLGKNDKISVVQAQMLCEYLEENNKLSEVLHKFNRCDYDKYRKYSR